MSNKHVFDRVTDFVGHHYIRSPKKWNNSLTYVLKWTSPAATVINYSYALLAEDAAEDEDDDWYNSDLDEK